MRDTPNSPDNASISLRRLVKTFGSHRAVDRLSLEVPTGSIFGLLGRNGAGKTTTLRMIMDILRPDEGEVRVMGRPMSGETKDRIGYLPEERGLYPKMKVIEMLEFQGLIKGLARSDTRQRASDWLDRLELGEWKQRKVEELSKGMQQKVQLAAALLARPDLLVLDEPFSGMDPINQNLFKDLILELNRSGTTVILSTHVMHSAEQLCHEIAVIDHGRVVLAGPLASIRERFGKNSVQLEFDGDGSFLKGLPGVVQVDDYGQYVEIGLEPGAQPQQLLEAATQRLRVRRFEVMVPTLHNIFLQEVGRDTADA